MELYPNSEDQEDLAAISLLPLPSFAVAWDPSIVRPSKLPERYDKRISAKYIFYLPSEDKYVVSKRCDGCRKAVQACDRAWPGCTRCVRSKKKCHVSDQGYVPLPGPKQERGKVLSSKGLTEMNPGVSAKTARTKRLERRPKNASHQELTSAVSTSNVHPGQRKSGKSKHNLLNPDEHGWDFIHPPKYERHSKMSAFESTPAHPQQPTLPPLWAASQADLLVALPHYPDIMDRQGLGCYGGFIDFFILEGSGWSDDSWVGRGTINLTRKWRLSRTPTAEKVSTEEKGTVTNSPRVEQDMCNPQPLHSDLLQSTTHSPLHSDCLELTLCPHQERQDECRLCQLGCPPRSPMADHLEHDMDADVSDDSSDSSEMLADADWDPNVSIDQRHCTSLRHDPPDNENAVLEGSGRLEDGLDPSSAISDSDMSLDGTPSNSGADDICGSVPVDAIGNVNTPGSEEKPIKLNELPVEAELFRTALETEEQIRVLVARDFSLLPFPLVQSCAYAFLGFFVIVKFETVVPSSVNTVDTVSLKLTLEWRHNGKSIDGDATSHPWWQSLLPAGVYEQLEMATNKRSAFSFPGIPSYPTVTPRSEPAKNIGDCSDEEFEDEDDSLTPAWHCTECGKLNMVDVFRSGWSWSCSNCGVLASSGYKNRLSVHLCDRNLPPPLPIPDPHGYLKHTVSAGPKGEEYITYKFQCTGIVLQHIPSSEHDHLLAQANTVLENLQAHVDFRLTDLGPKVSYLSYHIESRKAFVAAPRAAQEVWCFLEGLVTCRFGLAVDVLSYARELTELQCIAWRCKGSTKGQERKPGYTLFLSTGAPLTLTVYIRKQGEPQKNVQLEMLHGSLLFLHNTNQHVNFDVQHTGPSLLLAGRWISHAPKEALQVETLGHI